MTFTIISCHTVTSTSMVQIRSLINYCNASSIVIPSLDMLSYNAALLLVSLSEALFNPLINNHLFFSTLYEFIKVHAY